MNTEREDRHGEYWPEPFTITFDVKRFLNWIRGKMKFLFSVLLLFLVTEAQSQSCFYPAHNMAGYSEDMTNATGWNKSSTITDDTASTTPPEVYGITKTFKGVGTAAQTNFLNGQTGNKYVVTGAGYTLSSYMKYGNFQWVKFGVTGSATWTCNFDIQNGAVGDCTGLTTPTITSVGDGWYYVTVYYAGSTAGIANSFRLVYQYATSSSSAATAMAGTETIYITGAQAMDDAVTLPERKKYIGTTTFYKVWGNPKRCNYEFLTRPFENRTTEQITAGFE